MKHRKLRLALGCMQLLLLTGLAHAFDDESPAEKLHDLYERGKALYEVNENVNDFRAIESQYGKDPSQWPWDVRRKALGLYYDAQENTTGVFGNPLASGVMKVNSYIGKTVGNHYMDLMENRERQLNRILDDAEGNPASPAKTSPSENASANAPDSTLASSATEPAASSLFGTVSGQYDKWASDTRFKEELEANRLAHEKQMQADEQAAIQRGLEKDPQTGRWRERVGTLNDGQKLCGWKQSTLSAHLTIVQPDTPIICMDQKLLGDDKAEAGEGDGGTSREEDQVWDPDLQRTVPRNSLNDGTAQNPGDQMSDMATLDEEMGTRRNSDPGGGDSGAGVSLTPDEAQGRIGQLETEFDDLEATVKEKNLDPSTREGLMGEMSRMSAQMDDLKKAIDEAKQRADKALNEAQLAGLKKLAKALQKAADAMKQDQQGQGGGGAGGGGNNSAQCAEICKNLAQTRSGRYASPSTQQQAIQIYQKAARHYKCNCN